MDTTDLYIPVVLGTAREGRRSENAARFVHEQTKQYGVQTDLIDVRDFVTPATIPAWEDGEHTDEWREIIKRADALVIVSPEYNHGYPGELKIMLDKAYEEYHHKPAGICGVAAGVLGGARMAEVLRISLIELQMVPIRNAVYFSKVKELFNEQGAIQDDSYGDYVKGMLDELTWYAKALKSARNGS